MSMGALIFLAEPQALGEDPVTKNKSPSCSAVFPQNPHRQPVQAHVLGAIGCSGKLFVVWVFVRKIRDGLAERSVMGS